jgi:hypothetical protein
MSADSTAGFDHPPSVEINAIPPSIGGGGTWLVDVLGRLEAIGKLPKGWDSYGGDAIKPEIVTAAGTLAKSLARFPEVPRPHVSPTSVGGVQLEWEASGAYFEIHFEEPGEAQCYFESEPPPCEKEFIFHDGDDVSVLAQYASRACGS